MLKNVEDTSLIEKLLAPPPHKLSKIYVFSDNSIATGVHNLINYCKVGVYWCNLSCYVHHTTSYSYPQGHMVLITIYSNKAYTNSTNRIHNSYTHAWWGLRIL